MMKNPQEFINQWLRKLLSYEPSYPWANYIANSIEEFDNLSNYLKDNSTDVIAHINTDDECMEFSLLSTSRKELEDYLAFRSHYRVEEICYRIHTIFT